MRGCGIFVSALLSGRWGKQLDASTLFAEAPQWRLVCTLYQQTHKTRTNEILANGELSNWGVNTGARHGWCSIIFLRNTPGERTGGVGNSGMWCEASVWVARDETDQNTDGNTSNTRLAMSCYRSAVCAQKSGGWLCGWMVVVSLLALLLLIAWELATTGTMRAMILFSCSAVCGWRILLSLPHTRYRNLCGLWSDADDGDKRLGDRTIVISSGSSVFAAFLFRWWRDEEHEQDTRDGKHRSKTLERRRSGAEHHIENTSGLSKSKWQLSLDNQSSMFKAEF